MHMKKTIYAFVCACIFALTLSTPASAEQYLPKSISIENPLTYNAGDTVKVSIMESSNPIGLQKNIEYGVARTVDNDGLTYFEIVTTEYIDISKTTEKPNLSVVMPNILPQEATSTFVIYTKYFEKNAPENENFYFTKAFTIKPNNTPFVKIGNVNLLQSNGNRFSTLHGPTIYTPQEVAQDKTLATSSSIEITFESNTDTIIVPNITFSKLRSNSFKKDISLPPITIKKGKTYMVLPLPTFDYEPGVYTGELSFTSTLLKNKVDFQYIVAGDSVSVGAVTAAQKNGVNSFIFEIFSKPIDMDRIDSASTSAALAAKKTDIYRTQVDFIDEAGAVVYTTSQDADFMLQDFSVAIPEGTGKIVQVGVTIFSKQSNKTVYTGIKDVVFEGEAKNIIKPGTYIYLALYILLIIIGAFAIAGKHIKTAIFCGLVLIGLFITQKSFAAQVSLEPYRASASGSRSIRMYLQDDVISTTHTCGESVPFVFRFYYIYCANAVSSLKVGFSWDNRITPNQKVANGTGKADAGRLQNGHQLYATYSPYFTPTNLAKPSKALNSLYVSVLQQQTEYGNGAVGTNDSTTYTIPIKTTCTPQNTVCSCSGRTQICYQDGVSVSTTTNSASCALKASCTYTTSGNNVTFDTIATNALGSLSYKDNATNKATTKTVTKSRVGSSTVSHSVTVTDAFDKQTAVAVCSTDSVAAPQQAVDSRGPATITSFQAATPVVPKNSNCIYNWTVTNVDQCSLAVNNTSVLLQGDGRTGPISVSTANGLNQRAVITCIANGTPASGTTPATPSVTVSTTTLCQVLPEVIER